MKTQSLNGIWSYRVGKGVWGENKVPFSALPVGHSECLKRFDADKSFEKIFLKFDGITYQAKVILNGFFIGEMLPYSEYRFDISDKVKEKDNELLVEIEDISPSFGPSEGWGNYGGIIRNVYILYGNENYIEDVFFHSKLKDGCKNAEFTVETKACENSGFFEIELFSGEESVIKYRQENTGEFLSKTLENVSLWSPDEPFLYTLRVSLIDNGRIMDEYSCKVGFRELTCDRHRFILNGVPLCIKGVCKHEMFGNSGHCPTEEEMLEDMKMIKETGCNFVRLVHYPHNKKIIEIADEIGLMVSEEPGLWWSNTAHPEISAGSLEVLRRTILRDRNHPSVAFWLCFNECIFTEQFLIDSAKVCRETDPTRMVSGANCMSLEDTYKHYNICGFDFYTFHPYGDNAVTALNAPKVLYDKPLLYTEWGGHHVTDNLKMLSDIMTELRKMYLSDEDKSAISGAIFWEWADTVDFNRGAPSCYDGILRSGIVDSERKPQAIYPVFCNGIENMDKDFGDEFWMERFSDMPKCKNLILSVNNNSHLEDLLENIVEEETKVRKKETFTRMRPRRLSIGPVQKGFSKLSGNPYILRDGESIEIPCSISSEKITLFGMTSIPKGYPISGEYGEAVATMSVFYTNEEKCEFELRNGIEVTTVFRLLGSSVINPVAENAEPFAFFGYDKDFENYIMNKVELPISKKDIIERIEIKSENNGYALLLYGVFA